jgi:hypothetical protein
MKNEGLQLLLGPLSFGSGVAVLPPGGTHIFPRR